MKKKHEWANKHQAALHWRAHGEHNQGRMIENEKQKCGIKKGHRKCFSETLTFHDQKERQSHYLAIFTVKVQETNIPSLASLLLTREHLTSLSCNHNCMLKTPG